MTDAPLADDEIRLTLGGNPTLADLSTALAALQEMLDAIAEDTGAGHIDWQLTGLSYHPDP